MEMKFIEIRDAATFIPAIAVRLDGNDSWLARRAGYDKDIPCVLLTTLHSNQTSYDPFGWNTSARTIPMAHQYIIDHWSEIKNEGMVDVRVIVGEERDPALSERIIES